MPEAPLTLVDAAAALRAGRVTSVQLTEAAIDAADRLDGSLGTFVCRFDERAIAAAHDADAELAAGRDKGPLHGIPMGVKDIIACADGDTTAQSLVLDRSWAAHRDAPVVRRLKAAGSVIVGKTTTAEFALGMPDATKPFPVPRNPWNVQTWPGGSSSGAGSGVAAGMFYAGLGTDTAGSIRIPAAYCGVTGLMPTFGRVPKSGVVPLAYSLDHVGPLARSARDCAAVLGVIAGHHPSDPSSDERLVSDYVSRVRDDLTGIRVGVVRDKHFPSDADPALSELFEGAITHVAAMGATVTDVVLPYWAEMIAANVVTMGAEALAYHRVDTHRWHDYVPATRQALARAALVSGADYVQAQRVRTVAQAALGRLFADVDVVISPTTATGAPDLEALSADDGEFLERLYATIFTPYWNCVGNPVLAMPIGFASSGLPLSMQVAGRPFDEATVLDVATAYQSRTEHHLAVPTIGAAR